MNKNNEINTLLVQFDNAPDFAYNAMALLTPLLMAGVGLCGLIWYRYDVIRLFIALEIMILSVNLFFIQVSFLYTDISLSSQVIVPIVLAVAACEAAVGLALLVVAYRTKGSIEFGALNKLKG